MNTQNAMAFFKKKRPILPLRWIGEVLLSHFCNSWRLKKLWSFFLQNSLSLQMLLHKCCLWCKRLCAKDGWSDRYVGRNCINTVSQFQSGNLGRVEMTSKQGSRIRFDILHNFTEGPPQWGSSACHHQRAVEISFFHLWLKRKLQLE